MIKLSELLKEQGNKVEGYIVEIIEFIITNEDTGWFETKIRYKVDINGKLYDSVTDNIKMEKEYFGDIIKKEAYNGFQRCFYDLKIK